MALGGGCDHKNQVLFQVKELCQMNCWSDDGKLGSGNAVNQQYFRFFKSKG